MGARNFSTSPVFEGSRFPSIVQWMEKMVTEKYEGGQKQHLDGHCMTGVIRQQEPCGREGKELSQVTQIFD